MTKWNQAGLPPCGGCGHRRIYHTLIRYDQDNALGAGRGGRRGGREAMVPCSLPECDCREYAEVRQAESI